MIRVTFPGTGPVFGLVVENKVVVAAAAVAKWTVGKSARWVWNYYTARGCKVEWLPMAQGVSG